VAVHEPVEDVPVKAGAGDKDGLASAVLALLSVVDGG